MLSFSKKDTNLNNNNDHVFDSFFDNTVNSFECNLSIRESRAENSLIYKKIAEDFIKTMKT